MNKRRFSAIIPRNKEFEKMEKHRIYREAERKRRELAGVLLDKVHDVTISVLEETLVGEYLKFLTEDLVKDVSDRIIYLYSIMLDAAIDNYEIHDMAINQIEFRILYKVRKNEEIKNMKNRYINLVRFVRNLENELEEMN
jgi:hypothetical protein